MGEAKAPDPLEAWQAAGLRVTLFCPPLPKIEQPTWWTDLVGYPPDQVISQPKAGQYQEEGIAEDRKLVLQVQPERVDWHFVPRELPPGEVIEIPSTGSLPEALAVFAKLVGRWLSVSPPVTRLALGAVLFQPVENREAGYTQIGNYLPVIKLDPKGSTDFFYQINRPRISQTVKSLRLNRLSKWSVLIFQSFGVTLDKKEVQTVGYKDPKSACRLEFDINTSEDFRGELPRETLPRLFQELVDLGKEIAATGDRP